MSNEEGITSGLFVVGLGTAEFKSLVAIQPGIFPKEYIFTLHDLDTHSQIQVFTTATNLRALAENILQMIGEEK